jgi:hypothetical protein
MGFGRMRGSGCSLGQQSVQSEWFRSEVVPTVPFNSAVCVPIVPLSQSCVFRPMLIRSFHPFSTAYYHLLPLDAFLPPQLHTQSKQLLPCSVIADACRCQSLAMQITMQVQTCKRHDQVWKAFVNGCCQPSWAIASGTPVLVEVDHRHQGRRLGTGTHHTLQCEHMHRSCEAKKWQMVLG